MTFDMHAATLNSHASIVRSSSSPATLDRASYPHLFDIIFSLLANSDLVLYAESKRLLP